MLQPGALLFDDGAPLEPRVEAFLDRGAPPVYVGLGSMVDVDVRVTHAWVSEAARQAGVPQVVAPHEVDQSYWADRLARLGVAGPAVKARQRRGPELVTALRAVVEDAGLRERARKFKADLREDGVAPMVAALERPLNAADRADDPNPSGRDAALSDSRSSVSVSGLDGTRY